MREAALWPHPWHLESQLAFLIRKRRCLGHRGYEEGAGSGDDGRWWKVIQGGGLLVTGDVKAIMGMQLYVSSLIDCSDVLLFGEVTLDYAL